ncbi:DUF3868 domain-containing protein [uncultured Bacteroides sp.]|uniref:DUF3868 domain-containing protein n=1 Tax=uncultured Bacteroides sp. TaxID=162156 RepID=UPI0025FBDB05|nr:DUF3868 domain-containing protein [uncultured Bacteroides sp.]
MKRILLMAALMGIFTTVNAQEVVDGISVTGLKMERNGQYLSIDMTLNLSSLDVDGNRAVLFTPRLVNGQDSLDLPSVGIYGRRRYFYYVRNGKSMLSGKNESSYKASQKPDSILYNEVLSYKDWMNGSSLLIHRSDWGCCNTLLAEQDGPLGCHSEAFFPELVYVRPQGETVKSRSLEGSAYIDFPVNKTVIYPDYRHNLTELGKIQGTIDSVRNDRDVTITSVWLKGYASPESPYSHNKNLAIGRTDAMKRYIQQLYQFEEGVITTEYEPEDWDGLRRYVEQSNIDHREEILVLIDSDLDPDVKEAKIKRTYPDEYQFLLQNCYPSLRHTDYRISYNIRRYSNIEDIKRILLTQPQKLSLNELYLVAQEYEPGTEEFTDIFETAVRMYLDDETANLNAANAAMRRGDNARAERYLDKAGNSPEAIYAHGALAIRKKDYDTARRYLKEAEARGLKQATLTLGQLAQGRQ